MALFNTKTTHKKRKFSEVTSSSKLLKKTKQSYDEDVQVKTISKPLKKLKTGEPKKLSTRTPKVQTGEPKKLLTSKSKLQTGGPKKLSTRTPKLGTGELQKLSTRTPKLETGELKKLSTRKSKLETGDPKKLSTRKPKLKVKTNFVSLPYASRISKISKKYRIPIDLVETNATNIVKLVEENPKLKHLLFGDHFPIFLQLNVWKIPKCYPKLLRLRLEHSLVDEEDEVCLIVPDVKGIRNKEYDRHIDYYEELLKKQEVTGIKKIMTFHQLRAEYGSFELKRGLVDLYDTFLVDGRISGRVVRQLGKTFYKKRKIPTPIRMDTLRLKTNIEIALKKTTFQVHSKGDSFMVQIGHNKMSQRELVENIFSAIDSLDKQFPGGINNLKNVNIFAHRGSSLPIYIALADPNTVEVPHIKVKKPKLCKDVEGELTTQMDQKVRVKPSGDIIVKKVGR